MTRTATIQYDFHVTATVTKPKKKWKTWRDRIKVIASDKEDAKTAAYHHCLRRGWELQEVFEVSCKGVAFAFWDDTYELLDDEELAEFTTIRQ